MLVDGVAPRRKLVTRRDELWAVQGGTEDTDERVMTSHTEMCEGCKVTSVEEGHDVERVTVRSDVVMQTDQRKKKDHCHGQSVQHQVDERRR